MDAGALELPSNTLRNQARWREHPEKPFFSCSTISEDLMYLVHFLLDIVQHLRGAVNDHLYLQND